MDWAKSGEAMRLFRDVLPARASYPRKFDIMLVDEAHNVAPAGAGRYALESQRTAMIKLLSPHFQHKLFSRRHLTTAIASHLPRCYRS